MNRKASFLTSPKYGYDFVVAVTQAGINATLKQYLSGLSQRDVVMCYVANGDGTPKPIQYAELLKRTKNVDPFALPDGTSPSDKSLKALADADFLYAFKASIGIPPGLAPDKVPDIVELGDNTARVTYNLMCSTFQVVEVKYGPKGCQSWLNQSQPAGAPWLFTSQVDLRLTTTDPTAYSKLPADVQKQIKNLGGNAFSVQQLLFDLDNAALQAVPLIRGVDPGTPLYACLQMSFLGAYMSQLKASGQPVLGYSITQGANDPGSLTMTDLNMHVSPLVGTNGQPVAQPTPNQKDLCTLDYLCATEGHRLPAATQFDWNWVEANEQCDGAVAINRNTLAAFFEKHPTILGYVQDNCYKPYVKVMWEGVGEVSYKWSLTSGQNATSYIPEKGRDVLKFRYEAKDNDCAGTDGSLGKMEIKSSFDLTVTFDKNTIVITQHLVVFLRVQRLATSAKGNIVDKTIVDTYTLAATQDGKLAATLDSKQSDASVDIKTNGFEDFWTNLNDLTRQVKDYVRNMTSTNFTDLPVSTVQSFVFPGGRTFTYKDVAFSEHQDLTTRITYVQPG